MSERLSSSPYFPPRAGRAAGLWRAWFATRRALGFLGRYIPAPLARFRMPWKGLAVFFVPLLGLRLAARPDLWRFTPCLFGFAAFFALACIGQVAGGIALGLMAALHGFGVAAYLQAAGTPVFSRRNFIRQVTLVTIFTALALLLVAPATAWLVVPGATKDGIVLFNPIDRKPPLAPGALVLFRLSRVDRPGFSLLPGVYPGRVIANAGDRVEFASDRVVVNGRSWPTLQFMPVQGELVIPPERTLVWPVDLQAVGRIFGRGEFAPDPFLVADSALVGRSYKRWFWRTFDP